MTNLQLCIFSFILSMLLVFSGACGSRHSAADKEMDLAESLMNTTPDSALAILDGIDGGSLPERGEARLALLKSIALDKNMIDTTSFDVLQPAIDRYLDCGTPDEKLRTLYYRGRIFQNRGDDDMAMKSFLDAAALKEGISDSLLYARVLVAQGTLYYRQYKTAEFTDCNLEAAAIYRHLGKTGHEMKCYSKALDGAVILDYREKADSILVICDSLAKKYPRESACLASPRLAYTIAFGNHDEVRQTLRELEGGNQSGRLKMDMAHGYAVIGDVENGIACIEGVSPGPEFHDSLKYLSVKSRLLEMAGDHPGALECHKEYTRLLEISEYQILTSGLLFSEKKHELEMARVSEAQKKELSIWIGMSCVLALLVIIVIIYHRYRLGLTEKMNAERETQKLRQEISRIIAERDRLAEILKERQQLGQPLHKVVKARLDMLNGLLAKEITDNDSYAKEYEKLIGKLHRNKSEFLDSTRLAFEASHPGFIRHLESHGLTEDEMNYACLYALGLRGKDIGTYIQLKRHYSMSSTIRKKLGLGGHDTNIGIYVRRLMEL